MRRLHTTRHRNSQIRRRQVDKMASLFRFRLSFTIQVFIEIGRIEVYLGALFWNFNVSRPQDGVDYQSAKILIAPIAMEVAAGKPEASAAIWPIKGPGDNFLTSWKLPGGFGFPHVVRRCRLQNRGYRLLLRCKPDVEIPFILNCKWLHAAGDRVF